MIRLVIVLMMSYPATNDRRLRTKMSTAILTLALPDVLYQRLEQAAAATKQSLDLDGVAEEY